MTRRTRTERARLIALSVFLRAQGWEQQSIAERLMIPRSTVSTYIRDGLSKYVNIEDEYEITFREEEYILRMYPQLKMARSVMTKPSDRKLSMGSAVKEFCVNYTFLPGSSAAIGGGEDLSSFTESILGKDIIDMSFYTLYGGLAPREKEEIAPPQAIVSTLYEKTSSEVDLSSRLLPRTLQDQDSKVNSRIRAILNAITQCDVILTEIGAPLKGSFVEKMYHQDIFNRISSAGAAAVVAGRPIDKDGQPVIIPELEECIFGPTLDQLRVIATDPSRWVIGIGSGREHAEAVQVVTEAGYCNTLIIDWEIAEQLIHSRQKDQ